MLGLEPRTQKAIALIAAFPLLIAFQLALIALGASGRTLASVGVIVWFGGPALAIAGVVMLWRRERWQAAPSTPEGRLALWLLGGFAALFVVFWVMVAVEAGPDSPETPFENLYLAIPLMLAGGCAILGGFAAVYALFVRKERSLPVVGVLVIGVFVVLFTAGEIGGHDEPGGSDGRRRAAPPASPTAIASPSPRSDPTTYRTPTPTVRPSPVATTTPAATPAPNSHSNATAVEVAPGQVRVSFDYAYNHDPPGVTITAITVSPLDANRVPLPAYEPVVRPINKGSGHLDVTLTFTAEQLAEVRAFSVCFTAPGEPDLGCAVKEHAP